MDQIAAAMIAIAGARTTTKVPPSMMSIDLLVRKLAASPPRSVRATTKHVEDTARPGDNRRGGHPERPASSLLVVRQAKLRPPGSASDKLTTLPGATPFQA